MNLRGLRRSLRFWWQRRTRGWDDSETWNLETELAKWLAPRLRRYAELTNGAPCGYPHCTTEQEVAETDFDRFGRDCRWAAEVLDEYLECESCDGDWWATATTEEANRRDKANHEDLRRVWIWMADWFTGLWW